MLRKYILKYELNKQKQTVSKYNKLLFHCWNDENIFDFIQKRASHELKILFLDILILINLSFNLVLSIDILIKLFSVYFNI